MAFKKGQSGNKKGRPKGITDKRAKKWESLKDHLTNGETLERVFLELDALNGKDYIKAYTDLLSYVKPKLKSIEQKEAPPVYDFSSLTAKQKETFFKLLEKIQAPEDPNQ